MIENTLNIDKTIWLQSLKLKTTLHIISFCKLIGFKIKYSTNILVQWIYVVFKFHKVILPLFTILIIFRRTFFLRLFSGQIFTQSLNFWRQLNKFFQKNHSKTYMNENSFAFGNINKLIHVVFSSVTIVILYYLPIYVWNWYCITNLRIIVDTSFINCWNYTVWIIKFTY